MPNGTALVAAQVAKIADLIDYQSASIVSREILKGATGKVTLFAFDHGEGLSEHTSPFDALVQNFGSEAEISISGKSHNVGEREMILMPASQPHALKALKRFKMIIAMIRSLIPREPNANSNSN